LIQKIIIMQNATKKTNQFDLTNFFKDYSNFTGRTSRSDFWFFQAIIFVIDIVLSLLTGLIGQNIKLLNFTPGEIINIAFSLFILIPSYSISVRRLRDIGRSGYWILPSIITSIGALFPAILVFSLYSPIFLIIGSIYFLILLIFFLSPSQGGKNRFDKKNDISTEIESEK
jgi:uncharacterized membrane protein YhaH (DUF805 family)